MIKVIFQLVVCLLIGWAAYAWYALVLPDSAALIIALLLSGAALFSLLSQGLKIQRALLGGAVLALWPAGALAAGWAAEMLEHPISETAALAAAWPVALLAAKGSFAMAEKRDRARDLGNLSLGAVALYSVLAAAWVGEPLAMAFAAFGAGVIAANAAQQMILPPGHERFIMLFAKLAGAAGVLLLVRAWLT